MSKYVLDLTVSSAERIGTRYVLLKLAGKSPLPPMGAGQFVEVRIDHSPTTFLRRPISIHFVDVAKNELWLLVSVVGDGTRWLAGLQAGDMVNCVLPLGQGFTFPSSSSSRMLLVGGGVGVAPLLYLGHQLRERGFEPTFLLGGRTAGDIVQKACYERLGRVFVTTEDGSAGERGFVTHHTILQREAFTHIATCGPKPMMVAVARFASKAAVECEASLENLMACGLGACLCCVENTTQGNVCVCKEGPVFNVRRLLWQI